MKQKYIQDSKYRINCTMSKNIWKALKGAKSEQHWEDIVGYSIEQLCQHLESQFTSEMSWDNFGSYWEIDHIIPKNTFNFNSYQDKQFKLCWSLENLRPLSKTDNRCRPKDGSDILNKVKQNVLSHFES